mgnify:CR=1 FL=1
MSVRRPPKQPGSSNGTLRKCLVVLPSITIIVVAVYWVMTDPCPEATVTFLSGISSLQGVILQS